MSASHFKDVTNGYERRTDGLWVHSGKLSVGPPGPNAPYRAGDLNVSRGNGTGTVYFAGDTLRYIHFNGTGWEILPPLSGANIADGSIGTADIALNAVQQRIASYTSVPSWSTPAAGAWYETAIQATGTVEAGVQELRFEASFCLANSVAAAATYYGLAGNGALAANLGLVSHTAAAYYQSVSFIYYSAPPPPGSYRWGVMVYANAGQTTLWSGSQAALHVTEQKR